MKNFTLIFKRSLFLQLGHICVFILLSLFVTAQDVNYKVGDQLEVKWSGNWYTAKILEIRDGWYSIKYDVDGIVHSVQLDRMRPLDGYAYATTDNKAQPQTTQPATTYQNTTNNLFQAGDRVEVDKASINSWEKATVLPFLQNDSKDGKSFRVRLDNSSGVYLEGMVIPVERIKRASAEEQRKFNQQQSTNSLLYKKGSKVEVFTSNKWYKAEILEVNGDRYKVRFDGYTDYYDEWVRAAQMRKPTTNQTVSTKTNGDRPKPVLGANGLPLLPGTSWETLSISQKGNETIPQAPAYFNFCKSGKWSVNRYGNFGEIGSYKVSKNVVYITNNTDNSTTNYAMKWDPANAVLSLQNGNTIMKFGLASTNACGER